MKTFSYTENIGEYCTADSFPFGSVCIVDCSAGYHLTLPLKKMVLNSVDSQKYLVSLLPYLL